MIDILEAVKRIIEKYIVNIVPLTVQGGIGDTILSVESTRRCCVGDNIIVYNKPDLLTQATGEVHSIVRVIDRHSLEIDSPLQATYPVGTSNIEKLVGYTGGEPRFLEAVYLGDPAVIPRYPAITVDGKSRNSEWITNESTREDYEIEIAVYVDAADYEAQYRLMFSYVQQIEDALFRSLYPLVGPYAVGTLAADAGRTDTIVQLTDYTIEPCGLGWVFFENHDYLSPNRIVKYLGNSVYQLVRPLGFDFFAGDKLVKPTKHIFNTMPYSTRYGFINKKGGMLKASIVSYKASMEVKRLTPYIDPFLL